MKKTITKLNLAFFFIILSSVNSFAIKEPYLGEVLSGTIGKYGLGTEIVLPEGRWVVAGSKATNGGVRWVDLVLIQFASNKIKAIFNIKYPREKERPMVEMHPIPGWRTDRHYDNNTCDDYDDQGSNFHEELITKKHSSRLAEGSCISIYALNNISESLNINSETWVMAHRFIKENQLDYPNSIVFIDNTYFSEHNVVHTYYGLNPDFIDITSSKFINFRDSDWNKYNIIKHDEKNSFMSGVIYAGKGILSNNIRNFLNNKRLDFSEYAFLTLNINEAIPTTTSSNPSSNNSTVISKLKSLKSMLDEGLITQEQYEAKTYELLNDL